MKLPPDWPDLVTAILVLISSAACLMAGTRLLMLNERTGAGCFLVVALAIALPGLVFAHRKMLQSRK